MEIAGVTFPEMRIAEICRRYSACKLSLFGSILTPRFSGDSDVDLLVEFSPGARIGLLGIANMEAELSEAIGRRVDLRTPGDLSRYFRDDVVRQAKVLHAA